MGSGVLESARAIVLKQRESGIRIRWVEADVQAIVALR